MGVFAFSNYKTLSFPSLFALAAEWRSALLNAGYRVSFSHAALSSIKTDAPISFIWDVMCAWKRKYDADVKAKDGSTSPTRTLPLVEEDNDKMKDDEKAAKEQKQKKHGKKQPPSETNLRIVNRLMSRPPNPTVSFNLHPDANPPSRASRLLRQVAILLSTIKLKIPGEPRAQLGAQSSPPTEHNESR
ncbi:unnamed protein product [Hydatigera taeniaeformis]|uniref:tRNA (guanine(26)-N(2))-dimethyltransferase n=1 Tax=Hydatigena taeniaeformis TaxID=6205 RepID=A0A0R3X0P4_HYDTA|nr:unnamed protein product [Hydatigera taeniaeformis]